LIIADAGPLIALARIDLLSILRDLHGETVIPPAVAAELELSNGRPGSLLLAAAVADGWIQIEALVQTEALRSLKLLLDAGEAEAILLAEKHPGDPLLMDEKRGRSVARSRGIPVIGTGRALLIAKEEGQIDRVLPALDQLAEVGYRLSPALRRQLGELAGEIDPSSR
jgi:predicted nucleic acid-binding protein